jgi:hypothetical protein
METRAGRSLSKSGPTPVDTERWGPALVDLAFEFPLKMAGGVVNLLRPGSSRRGRDRVRIAPMSYDWVRQCSVDADKHGDLP